MLRIVTYITKAIGGRLTRTPSQMLMQTAADVVELFGHGATADCRILPHSGIAVTGAQASDLNMIFLTSGATSEECEEALEAVCSKGVDALLVIDEGAENLRLWANRHNLNCVGQMPLMERKYQEVCPSSKFHVRLGKPQEGRIANKLAAAAFSLDEAACNIATAAGAFEAAEIDLWVAEDQSGLVGCGTFIGSDERVGIYTMATLPENQGRGVGRAIIETAMAYYQDRGVKLFTLGATEKGFPLYSKIGFEVITRPHVYVIGASTQFPGG